MRSRSEGGGPYWPALLLLLVFVPAILSVTVVGDPELRFFEAIVRREAYRGALAGFVLGIACPLAIAGLWRAVRSSHRRRLVAGEVTGVVLSLFVVALLFPFIPSRYSNSYDDAVWQRVPWMPVGCLVGLCLAIVTLVARQRWSLSGWRRR